MAIGPLKAECDRIVQAALGRQATIVRPTYIVGPGDDSDRFTYWVERMARGGDPIRDDLGELLARVVHHYDGQSCDEASLALDPPYTMPRPLA